MSSAAEPLATSEHKYVEALIALQRYTEKYVLPCNSNIPTVSGPEASFSFLCPSITYFLPEGMVGVSEPPFICSKLISRLVCGEPWKRTRSLQNHREGDSRGQIILFIRFLTIHHLEETTAHSTEQEAVRGRGKQCFDAFDCTSPRGYDGTQVGPNLPPRHGVRRSGERLFAFLGVHLVELVHDLFRVRFS